MKQIEDAFKEFTSREDVAIVLISQYVSIMQLYVQELNSIFFIFDFMFLGIIAGGYEL